jgi:hypothetical protein
MECRKADWFCVKATGNLVHAVDSHSVVLLGMANAWHEDAIVATKGVSAPILPLWVACLVSVW